MYHLNMDLIMYIHVYTLQPYSISIINLSARQSRGMYIMSLQFQIGCWYMYLNLIVLLYHYINVY